MCDGFSVTGTGSQAAQVLQAAAKAMHIVYNE